MLVNIDAQKMRKSSEGYIPRKSFTAPGKTHQCPYCSYSSNKTTNLKNHVRVHTGERPYVCPHCPYRATQENNLKSHIRIHTGEKPHACNYCPYRSIKITTLRRHIQTHHGPDAADESLST